LPFAFLPFFHVFLIIYPANPVNPVKKFFCFLAIAVTMSIFYFQCLSSLFFNPAIL